jgi:hypothetical protein
MGVAVDSQYNALSSIFYSLRVRGLFMSNQTTRSTGGKGGTNKSLIRQETVSGQILGLEKRFCINDRVYNEIEDMHKKYVEIITRLNRLCELDVFQYGDVLSKLELPPIYAGLIQPSSIRVEPKRNYLSVGITKHPIDDIMTLQDVYDLVAVSQELNEQSYSVYMKVRKGFSFTPVFDKLQPVTWESVEDKCAFYSPETFDGDIFNIILYGGDSQLRGNFDSISEFVPFLVKDVLYGVILDKDSYPRGDGAIPIRRYFQAQDQVSLKGGVTATAQNE